MSENVLYTVFWENMNDNAYLYGSSLRYLNRQFVQFENRLMPSGIPINEWQSFTDFQADRHEPKLPVFSPGQAVAFRAFYKDYPRGTVIFKAVFYDRRKQRIDSVLLTGRDDRFVLPEDTFTYVIQMVNGGTEKVTFGYMELIPEEHTVMHSVIRRDSQSDTLHILVPPFSGRMIRLRDEDIPEELTNVTVISPNFFTGVTAEQINEIKRLEMLSYGTICVHCASRSCMQHTGGLFSVLKEIKETINVKTEYWDISDDK